MAINTKAVISDTVVDLMNQAVIISGQIPNKVDQFADVRIEERANSISFNVFSRMALATTPLTDGTEATSASMAEAKVTMTPAEYGLAITTTSLAELSSGGKAARAAGELVGLNMGETMDKLGVTALEAGTNTIAAGTSGTLAKTDLRAAYQALVTAGIQKFSDGRFVAFVNPAQVSDIKDVYISIAQNTNMPDAVNGMVGSLEGFTIIEDANVTAGKVVCFGRNGLGKAVSLEPSMTVQPANDNLGRLAHVGWYGVMQYGIVDNNAVRVITGA
jgi:N4-gp56 family major capsid protein